jgi:sugar/nucleoside kinase (ribokinase family)
VPFALQTVLDLTNLNLTVQTDDSHLHILGVTPGSPEVVSIVLGTANSNGLPIAFTLNPAAIPTTNHVLAWLNFQGITNLDSAIVPLTITHFSTTRSSGQVVPAATANGQVILIVSKPILVVSGKPQFGITMYGLPGATYAIETTTNLASPGWHELERLLESGRVLTLTGLTNNAAQQFYRTEQVGP